MLLPDTQPLLWQVPWLTPLCAKSTAAKHPARWQAVRGHEFVGKDYCTVAWSTPSSVMPCTLTGEVVYSVRAVNQDEKGAALVAADLVRVDLDTNVP